MVAIDHFVLFSLNAGLRGAVAVALALNIRTEHRSVIVTTTLFVVLFTTLVLGILTAPVLRLLGLQQPEEVCSRCYVMWCGVM